MTSLPDFSNTAAGGAANSLASNEQSVKAAALISSMLREDFKPNGALPELGPWFDLVQQIEVAYRAGGAPAARSIWNTITRAKPELWGLVSGDAHHDGSHGPRFRLIPAGDLGNLPRPVWLLRDRIQRGGFGVLYGPSGVGKSFIALDWALQVAQSAPVVYIAAEGVSGYAARVLAWCKHHKIGPGQLDFVTTAVNLLDGGAVAEFIEAVREVSPALIVVDTLARCLIGGDENSARDMGLAVAAVDMIRRETGAAVLLIHHTNKAASGERGSSALRGAADAMIELGSLDSTVKVTCAKSKDSPEFPAYHLKFVVLETGRQTDTGAAETSCVLLPADQVLTFDGVSTRGRQILDCLGLYIFRTHGAPSKDIEAATGISRSSMFNALTSLVRGGYVRQATTREPYFITDKGLEVIGVKVERVPLEDV